jgi:hypothetical protein
MCYIFLRYFVMTTFKAGASLASDWYQRLFPTRLSP